MPDPIQWLKDQIDQSVEANDEFTVQRLRNIALCLLDECEPENVLSQFDSEMESDGFFADGPVPVRSLEIND